MSKPKIFAATLQARISVAKYTFDFDIYLFDKIFSVVRALSALGQPLDLQLLGGFQKGGQLLLSDVHLSSDNTG